MQVNLTITKKHFLLGAAAVILVALGIWLIRSGKNPTHGISPNQGKNYTIEISADGFKPDKLELKVGDTVTFVNNDTKPRWPASDPHPTHDYYSEFDPKQGIAPNDSWDFTFTKEGTWGFHDHFVPHQKGEIVVGKATAENSGDDIKALLAETDKQKQAKIVHAMAEKYGTLETLSLMQRAGLPYTGETHLLVHEIGNVAYQKYGQDALKYCTDAFLSACYHGVILNELGEHGLEGVGKMVESCKSAGPGVLSQCAHAAGHGFLAWKNYKLLEALPFCDKLHDMDNAIPEFNCHDGAFMENIFGVHDGAPSPNRMIKQDDPYYPCNAVPAKYVPGCYADQATVMYEIYKGDLRKIALGCDGVTDENNKRICYDNFARQIHPITLGKADKAIELCKNATGIWQDQCLISIVSAAFSVGDKVDMPYALCPAVQNAAKQNECYEVIIANISSYARDAVERRQLCGYIKSDGWKVECQKRYQ